MEAETWRAPVSEDGAIPNNPRFAVLVYRGTEVRDADEARERFEQHGWGGTWVSGVLYEHHFHSTSHEALAVVAGEATLELGGPQGEAFEVRAGDVLVLPAGTGHRRRASSEDFRVVGAYPPGQEDYDMCFEADDAARERIAALGPPPTDPIGGDGIDRWSQP